MEQYLRIRPSGTVVSMGLCEYVLDLFDANDPFQSMRSCVWEAFHIDLEDKDAWSILCGDFDESYVPMPGFRISYDDIHIPVGVFSQILKLDKQGCNRSLICYAINGMFYGLKIPEALIESIIESYGQKALASKASTPRQTYVRHSGMMGLPISTDRDGRRGNSGRAPTSYRPYHPPTHSSPLSIPNFLYSPPSYSQGVPEPPPYSPARQRARPAIVAPSLFSRDTPPITASTPPLIPGLRNVFPIGPPQPVGPARDFIPFDDEDEWEDEDEDELEEYDQEQSHVRGMEQIEDLATRYPPPSPPPPPMERPLTPAPWSPAEWTWDFSSLIEEWDFSSLDEEADIQTMEQVEALPTQYARPPINRPSMSAPAGEPSNEFILFGNDSEDESDEHIQGLNRQAPDPNRQLNKFFFALSTRAEVPRRSSIGPVRPSSAPRSRNEFILFGDDDDDETDEHINALNRQGPPRSFRSPDW